MFAWEAEGQLRDVQPVPPRQAPRQLRGLRRLHAWETKAVLRGVLAVSARQGEVLVRGVRAEALTAQALAPAGA